MQNPINYLGLICTILAIKKGRRALLPYFSNFYNFGVLWLLNIIEFSHNMLWSLITVQIVIWPLWSPCTQYYFLVHIWCINLIWKHHGSFSAAVILSLIDICSICWHEMEFCNKFHVCDKYCWIFDAVKLTWHTFIHKSKWPVFN